MKWMDRAAILGMGAGIALMLLPSTFRAGFFATLAFTLLHVFTSHRRAA